MATFKSTFYPTKYIGRGIFNLGVTAVILNSVNKFATIDTCDD